jgi:D-serine deaminase-like pyridoxal phosphate-dependent protein
MPDARKKKRTRRTILIGGGALALAGIGAALRPPKEGYGGHDAYFAGLSQALARAEVNRPVLVIDRQRLDANIRAVRASLAASGLPLRVVAKSLPSPRLIETVMDGMASERLMLFSEAMLEQVAPLHPQADILLGKPLPVGEFIRFADAMGAETAARVQWLIDTPQRLDEYGQAAKARNIPLKASIEIDVGLHRGGFGQPAVLVQALRQALPQGGITVSGLMGYDAHVPKMPWPGAYEQAQAAYAGFIAALGEAGIAGQDRLTFNAAGSPTFRRHAGGTVANEVAVGSAFVKPGDFDLADLDDLVPAAFIATPVLKASDGMDLPGVEFASPLLHWWDRNSRRGFFIHGGHWLAKPVSPAGLRYSGLYGRSSNQELLTGSAGVTLSPGDHVFLRPNQSEAVFLLFGDIAVFDGGEIAEWWPTLPISA